MVDLHQFFTDGDTEVGVALIDNLIGCTKHHVGRLTVWGRLLLTDNQYRTNDQQYEKRQLPDQFFLLSLIHNVQISIITLKVAPSFVS